MSMSQTRTFLLATGRRAAAALLSIAAVAAASLATPAAFGQSTWTGATSGLWNDGSNWSTPLADNFNTGLVFAGSSNVSTTNNLTGGTASSLTFNAGGFTLGGNSLTLAGNIFNGAAGSQTISLPVTLLNNTVNVYAVASATTTISGNISGGVAAGSTAIATGTTAGYLSGASPNQAVLVLSGSNSFTGNVSMASGSTTLRINHPNALSSGTLIIGGGTPNIDNTSGAPITIANNIRATGASPTYVGTGNSTLITTGTIFVGNTSRTVTVSSGTFGIGAISWVSGTFVKAGGGTLLIAGPADTATAHGPFAISSGTLVVGNNTSTGTNAFNVTGNSTLRASSPNLILGNAATNLVGGSLTVDGTNGLTFNGGITLGVQNRTLTNNLTANSLTLAGTTALQESGTGVGRTLTVAGSGNTIFSGAIVNGGTGGNSNLTITNTGVTTLSGVNTYSGSTTVSNGVVWITSTAALPGYNTAGRFSVAANATLGVTNAVADADVQAMAATGNYASTSRFGFDTSAGDRTLSGTWSGSMGLTKIGANTLTLTTPSVTGTIQGAVTISGGTLAFNTNGTYQSIGGTVSGPGAFVKLGTNNLNFDAASGNALTGPMYVNGGGLFIKSSLGSGDIILSGSTVTSLSLRASGTYVNPITIGNIAGTSSNGAIDTNTGMNSTTTGTITITGSVASSSGGHFGSSSTGSLTVNGPVNSASVPVTQSRNIVVYGGGGTYSAFRLMSGSSRLGANDGLSTSAAVTIATTGNGTLDLNGFSQRLTGITRGGSTAFIGNGSTSSDSTLTITGSSTFSGSIVDAVGAGTRKLNLTVDGGSLTLSGSNSYSGPTVVQNAGTLALASNNALAPSAAVAVAGSTLAIGEASNTINALSTSGNSTVSVTINGGNGGSLSMGNLSFGAGTNTLALSMTNPTAGLYNVLTYSGSLTGSFTPTGLDSRYTLLTAPASAGSIALQRKADVGAVVAAPAAASIITGGSTAIAYTVANATPSGGASLSFASAAGGNVAGSSSGTALANATSGSIAGLFFTGTSIGLNQTGSFTVSDLAAITTTGTGSVSVNVLDHSLPAFGGVSSSLTTLALDFGSVNLADGLQTQAFSLTNLASVFGQSLTSGLALTGFQRTSGDNVFSTNLATFANLVAGGTNSYTASFTPGAAGSYTDTFVLSFADNQSLAGATAQRDLTVTMNVVVVPEPGALVLAAMGVAGLAWAARRRAAR